MSKSPSSSKRAARASSPAGTSQTPTDPAPPQTEPRRVQIKSPSGRKRVSQAASPTGKGQTPPIPMPRETEPLRGEGIDIPASVRPSREDRSLSSEQIALRAYHLWLARGRTAGSDWDDWLEAERQLAASA
jgi:Protein of unknown function (DUF2934)